VTTSENPRWLITSTRPSRAAHLTAIEAIEGGGPKMVAGFDKTAAEIGPGMLKSVEDFAAAKGYSTAPCYRPMMEALSTGGIAKLKELVKAGTVPVVAFSAIPQAVLDPSEYQ
jgi:hypothetical protein